MPWSHELKEAFQGAGARVAVGVAAAALIVGIGAGAGVVSLAGSSTAASRPVDLGAVLQVHGIPQSFSSPPWRVVDGAWQAANEQAFFSAQGSKTHIAVLDVGIPVEAAQVRLAAVGDGSGLVFGYRDPGDYWAVTAAPAYATWTVVHVAHGVQTQGGNLGLSSTDAGSILAVVIRDGTADIGLDGKVERVVSDPTLRGTATAGVGVAAAGAARTRFEDFQLVPVPLPATRPKPTPTRPAR